MDKSIGALWENESKNGKTFLKGSIEIDGQKIAIICFKNDLKEKDTHPDWRIFVSKPKEDSDKSDMEAF